MHPFFIQKSINYKRLGMNTRHFSQLPKAALAYPKVVQGLIFKKPKGPKILPQVEYVVDTLEIDQNHLKAYNEVCGFQNNGFVPAIYLAVLSHLLFSRLFGEINKSLSLPSPLHCQLLPW